MEDADGSQEKWIAPSLADAPVPTPDNLNPIDTVASENLNTDNRALFVELSILNRQLVAFAWRLLDSGMTAGEQLSLVVRMEMLAG